MTHRYSHVDRYTHQFYAEQRDTLDREEWKNAIRKDGLESESEKAWRNVLMWHSNVSYQISNIHRALYDMGATLTPRGRLRIEAMLRMGWKWCDPKPEVSLRTAQKHLMNNLAALQGAWNALHEAEAKEKGDTRQGVAPISQNLPPDEKQSV